MQLEKVFLMKLGSLEDTMSITIMKLRVNKQLARRFKFSEGQRCNTEK